MVHFNANKRYGRLNLLRRPVLTSMGLCASLTPSNTEVVRAGSEGKPTQQSELQLQASEAIVPTSFRVPNQHRGSPVVRRVRRGWEHVATRRDELIMTVDGKLLCKYHDCGF